MTLFMTSSTLSGSGSYGFYGLAFRGIVCFDRCKTKKGCTPIAVWPSYVNSVLAYGDLN